MHQDPMDERAIERFEQRFTLLRDEICKVIVGQVPVVEGVISALVSGGHVLLEGVPGLGKTLLVRTLAQALSLDTSRVQFTPDLMPADILGTHILTEDDQGRRTMRFEPGPVFTQVLLADEINRATPKTQSALLEAMQERQVTSGGVRRALPAPFFVLATQNPLEMEGTYPLPEAQLDRFLSKILVPFPSLDELSLVMDRTTSLRQPAVQPVLGAEELLQMQQTVRAVLVAEPVKRYALRLVLATHPLGEGSTEASRRHVRYGSSPRGGQALLLGARVRALLAGRAQVGFADIQAVAAVSLRHRIVPNFEAEAEGLDPDDILRQVLDELPEVEAEIARAARAS